MIFTVTVFRKENRMPESNRRSLEEVRSRQQLARLEKEKSKWQALLPSCVVDSTGDVDREREDYYWSRIKDAESKIKEIESRPVRIERKPAEYAEVRRFLEGISGKWENYSSGLRSRFLKLIIDKVEIRGQFEIEAIIY